MPCSFFIVYYGFHFPLCCKSLNTVFLFYIYIIPKCAPFSTRNASKQFLPQHRRWQTGYFRFLLAHRKFATTRLAIFSIHIVYTILLPLSLFLSSPSNARDKLRCVWMRIKTHVYFYYANTNTNLRDWFVRFIVFDDKASGFI